MEKPHRMAQIYGYIVCLVAVITFIICLANIVPAVINLSDPLHSANMFQPQGTPSLASFDNYKMDILKSLSNNKNDEQQAYIPDDATLKGMYDAALNDRIQTSSLIARRSIIVNSIIILVSIALFLSHWIWIKNLAKKNASVREFESV